MTTATIPKNEFERWYYHNKMEKEEDFTLKELPDNYQVVENLNYYLLEFNNIKYMVGWYWTKFLTYNKVTLL